MTCAEIFAQMEERFRELEFSDIHAVFQFNIHGDGGGHWHAVCEGNFCRVQTGVFPRPDLTVTTSAGNAVKLAEGRLSPTLALLTRRVRLKGDMVLALQIKTMLKPRA
ncbi:MAG: SCP2 sterol-binding domain-containing protein [Thermodesulfobacteriota bacterium]|nr:SCP2 sterol-binding domain-containing protein [Thermodesulfobacteriota bacterium]